MAIVHQVPGAPMKKAVWRPQGMGTIWQSMPRGPGPRLTQAVQSDLQSVASDYTLFLIDRHEGALTG